jgi:5-methylcytosine-specific restriction endonuclease McrA
MKNHTRVYLESRGLTEWDWIGCEVCGRPASDIHHIQPRGMGGSKFRDTPDNLIALCRFCHIVADFGTMLPKEYLSQIVNDKLHGTTRKN